MKLFHLTPYPKPNVTIFALKYERLGDEAGSRGWITPLREEGKNVSDGSIEMDSIVAWWSAMTVAETKCVENM